MERSTDDLIQKVEGWLQREGYPLEFATAAAFERHGFWVWSGEFVEDPQTAKLREVDVSASSTIRTDVNNGFLRLTYVAECKWTADKPWVIFHHEMPYAPSARIAQTISDHLGHTSLWMVAGDERLHGLDTFATPLMVGTGGRRAFTSGDSGDQVYSALRSVISASVGMVESGNKRTRPPSALPDAANLFLPLIVIDGPLMTASYDTDGNRVSVTEVDHTRVFMRGSEVWPHRCFVDVVRIEALDDFISRRAQEIPQIFEVLGKSIDALGLAAETNTWEQLPITGGPRGMIGYPYLLRSHFAKDNESVHE